MIKLNIFYFSDTGVTTMTALATLSELPSQGGERRKETVFECEILDFGGNGLAFSVVDGDTATEERLENPVIRKDYAGHRGRVSIV